jgi:hypothetical protein
MPSHIKIRDLELVVALHFETHLATSVSNQSRLISEYVRSFMKRIEEERPLTQLQLSIN